MLNSWRLWLFVGGRLRLKQFGKRLGNFRIKWEFSSTRMICKKIKLLFSYNTILKYHGKLNFYV